MTSRSSAQNSRRSVRFLLLLATSLIAGAGCTTSHPAHDSLVQSPAFDVSPQQLAKDVKKIVGALPISLPVEDEQAGAIVTGWKPYQGDLHIMRYWYERTRFHITVLPDFNDPARRSRIQVTDETQQRPEESGPNETANKWTPAPELHRPERSSELLQQIQSQLAAYPRSAH